MSHTLELERPKVASDQNNFRRPVTLDGPRKSIRPVLFKSNSWKASFVLLVGISFHALSYMVIYFGMKADLFPILILGWGLAGMSVTSLFVIGHDCAHASFLKNNKIGDLIGHFCFLFSFYPYYGWKFTHNAHHAHTNDLTFHENDVYFDNAWLPFTSAQYLELKTNSPLYAFLYKSTRYFPPIGSFLHNIAFHAYPRKFIATHRSKLILSYAVLGIGVICLSIGLVWLTGSAFAILHFLLIPGILFQFWMSYYTFLHHTSTEIEFYSKEDWTPYLGQILSTYNSLCPRWLSFLHFHIDIHTPHHLSTAIPCYHLKEAYADLKKSEYASDLKEGRFRLSYLWKQMSECHVWDLEKRSYRKFSEIEG